jgi:PTS system nitrogen regulatory IIA component
MELGLQDAARLLGVSAETVQRWARQGRLGVLRPSGDFQVGLEELRTWAAEQGLRLRESSAAVAPPSPLHAALGRGGVRDGVSGAGPDEVLADLVAAAPLAPGADRAAMLQQLRARENMASTGFGGGVALPHPRTPSRDFVSAPLVLIGLLARPVDWRALDGRPVHTAILLASPTPQEHLQILSRLAFLLRDARFCSALESRAAGPEILALAERLEPPAAQ